MRHTVHNNECAREESSFFRRSIMAMAIIAVFGYVIAFVQADRGSMYYKQYASAYTDCFYHIVEAGAEAVDCNRVPEVLAPLVMHREAYAAGEPFLNLALSLTVAIMLSPLFRRISRTLVDRFHIGPTAPDAA